MFGFFDSLAEMSGERITLTGENAQHAKVLRLKAGEQVLLCDGEGCEALCVVEEMDGKTLTVSVLSRRESTTEPAVRVSVYMAFPKAD